MADSSEGAHDVIVVGSGGAGLVAACAAADRGLRVTVFEGAEFIGGTTALSGGHMWIPNSTPMSRAGFQDSRSDALTYLRRITMGTTPPENLHAFVDNGPRFIDYLERELGVRVESIARPDYHPGWRGAASGRTHEPLPVPTEGLGEWSRRVRTSLARPPLTSTEIRDGNQAQLNRRRKEDVRTQGAGLIAGLVTAALDRQVTLHTDALVTALSSHGNSWSVTVDGASRTASTVIIATGGFASNDDLRHDFLPPVQILPTGGQESLGSGILLGTKVGARLHGMSEAWWTAAATIPPERTNQSPTNRNVVRELAYPGSILVNADGQRFVNEASSYNDLGKAFLTFRAADHSYPNEQAWLIFDAEFRARRTVLGVAPDAEDPAWFTVGESVEHLARKLRISPDALARTLTVFNEDARRGHDTQFGRGASPHDQFNGDASHRPNSCLRPLLHPPFYAIPIALGANGTKGGLLTDSQSRVIGTDGSPIPGLYAVGEAAAALMGPGYAGSGASLGPSMTAAYVLGRTLARDTEIPPLGAPMLPRRKGAAPAHPLSQNGTSP